MTYAMSDKTQGGVVPIDLAAINVIPVAMATAIAPDSVRVPSAAFEVSSAIALRRSPCALIASRLRSDWLS